MPPLWTDPHTDFTYPGASPAPWAFVPEADLAEALRSMILSASGWRKVFAAGGEESSSDRVADADRLLACGIAETFASFLRGLSDKPVLRVAVGLDARFTGPVLADGMVRVLLSRGIRVDYLGIVAAPEIMAWVQKSGIHDGFIYVSASHNPLGHNGVKLGLGDGGVVGGAASADLIARFRRSAALPAQVAEWGDLFRNAPEAAMAAVLEAMPEAKRQAAQAYAGLCDEILTLTSDPHLQTARKAALAALVRTTGLGIVGELNGSARGLSIDEDWLGSLGCRVKVVNGRPRQIVHRIVPEGASLDLCRRELDGAWRQEPGFCLGYVPDCDGDRGNVVYLDPAQGAKILEAQEVFALCVLSELAGLWYYGAAGPLVAVVCNDPTSLRIDAIAEALGAQVFRAEVGEANVVGRARQLRQDGWTVRILGEGSNGGNITHPGSVRDPLSTLGSLLKLLCLRSTPGKPGLFELWCQKSGQPEAYRPDFGVADILAALPRWTTTPTSDDRAILKVQTSDHGALKAKFEKLWATEWPQRQDELRARFGVESWDEVNYEGTAEKPGIGPSFRSGRQTGGVKIRLLDAKGTPAACLWMRGSGTEPVFRILAEVRGNDKPGEAWLLDWLTTMVRQAEESAE